LRSTRDATAALRVDLGRLRADVRSLFWRLRQPSEISVRGVRLKLQDTWATPPIREDIYADRYELREYEIITQTLRADDRYLELGAGIGFITTCACKLVGEGRVFAYEPNPQLAQVAESTARANGFRLSVTSAVLGPDDGEAEFFVTPDFWASSLRKAPEAVQIQVPMRSFAAELQRVKPSYLMVDIEGAEVELLRGEKLPGHVRAICMELHTEIVGLDSVRRLLSKLLDEGFSLDLAISGGSVAYLARADCSTTGS
jgi:FkbM family methyltransferase